MDAAVNRFRTPKVSVSLPALVLFLSILSGGQSEGPSHLFTPKEFMAGLLFHWKHGAGKETGRDVPNVVRCYGSAMTFQQLTEGCRFEA